MTGLLLRGLLVSIALWLGVTLILDLVGDAGLSSIAFFAGGSLVMALGLLLLTQHQPTGITIRLSIIYSSIVLFSLGAALFVYSYVITNAQIAFYLALTLMIIGTGQVYFGVKRTPMNRSRGTAINPSYSLNRFRLWGALIGLGFSLVFASVLLGAWGIRVFDWSTLITVIILGIVLVIGSCIGLRLEFRKSKEEKQL